MVRVALDLAGEVISRTKTFFFHLTLTHGKSVCACCMGWSMQEQLWTVCQKKTNDAVSNLASCVNEYI